MSEADNGLTTEGALELSKERLGQKPPPATQEPDPAVEQQPDAAQAAADGEQAEATPGDGKPGGERADFSWVQDPQVRAALEQTNDSTVAKWLKDWDTQYRKATQERSEAKKAADDYRKKAELYDTFDGDEDVRAAIAGAIQAKSAKKQATPFPWDTATAAEIQAEIERIADAKAEAKAEAKIRERVQAPQERVQAVLGKAASMFQESWKDRMSKEQYLAAWEHARQHYGDDAFQADNVEQLFGPILEAAATKAELDKFKGAQAGAAKQALKATSPAGTAGSVAARPTKPQAKKPDGKPETAREATKAALLERYGWTERDLDEAARGPI